MIAVYAIGAGLGHLTRVRAAAHTLGYVDEPVVLLTDSIHSTDSRVVGHFLTMTPSGGLGGSRPQPGGLRRGGSPSAAGTPTPPHRRLLHVRHTSKPDASPQAPIGLADDPRQLATWVERALDSLQPDQLWIDAFPAGIRGELTSAVARPDMRTVHFARLLQWPKYSACMPAQPLRLDHTYVMEPLADEHHRTLVDLSSTIEPFEVHDPPTTADWWAQATVDALPRPRWLIAHAGPEDEVLELVAYAQDLAEAEEQSISLVVAAPNPVDGLTTIDTYPVWPLFEHVDRVITAAGFNSMRQAEALGLGDRHRFLPFPRRHDDQFERARRVRAALQNP